MEKLDILQLENGEYRTTFNYKFKNRNPYEQPKNVVTAAIPGTILSVLVKEGQQVKRGDALCVLDSMKMNNTICAANEGIVKKVYVAVGAPIAKDAPMIEFE